MANLTQLRMLEDLNGFLLVDKPAGMSFSTVVKTVKRKFNLVKVGHGGSLDAMASGLLVLMINDANKFVDDVMGGDRECEGTIRLGTKTNTGDIHGEVLKNADGPMPDAAKLESAVKEFKGDIFQTEPRFCSIRKEGTADYEIADTGEHKQFLAHVYRLSLEAAEDRKLKFSMTGTKGVIMRAMADDLGDFLGCGATLESLRRTKVWKFSVADAIPFDRLLETELKDFAECVLPQPAALQ